MKYSVIIPIYNAESTLRRCVDSLLDQQYSDVEIILVNDGSSDNSASICEEYTTKFDSVKYLPKKNGGVSSARNTGLDIATGKYVLFVDSDDYVSDKYFQTLDTLDPQADYVFFSFHVLDENTVSEKIFPSATMKSIDECVPFLCTALYKKTISSPWNKRYIREIIEQHNIRFPEDISIGEDKVFNLAYALNCQSCVVSSEPLYFNSLEKKDSLSRKVRSDLQQQFALLDVLIQQVIRTCSLAEDYRQQFIAAENLIQLRSVYSEAKRMHIAGKDSKSRRKLIYEMCCQNNAHPKELPGGMFSTLLQIPVRLKFVTVIDLIGWYLAR